MTPARAEGAAPVTSVELQWIEGRIERWIRFGRIAHEQMLDRGRRVVGFAPGEVFAFVRWAANDHGTAVSRLDILRAVRPEEPRSTVPCVTPGADILLRAISWPQVDRALKVIDAIEQGGIDPCEVAPDHWRHVHDRIAARQAPRTYTRERHLAWLRRRRLS